MERIRKANVTAPVIHLQSRADKPGHFKNLCGNGNSYRSNTIGEPQPPKVFYEALKLNSFRCCPTCIKQAIIKGFITVVPRNDH